MARDRSGEGSDRRVLSPLHAHQHVVADPRGAPHLAGAGAVTRAPPGVSARFSPGEDIRATSGRPTGHGPRLPLVLRCAETPVNQATPSASGAMRAGTRGPERRSPRVRAIVLGVVGAGLVLALGAGAVTTLSEGRIGAEAWRSLIVGGVARGSVYAIIAVGYTLVYGVLFMINFAHGEVFMAGAFSTLFVARALAERGMLDSNPILSIAILLVVSALVSTLVAVVLERVAYRPLRGAPRLVPLITAIGASLFLQYTFRGLYG